MDILLTIALIRQWKTCGGELLADPAVGENHEETAHDGKIAQEEVEVEDEAVAEGLGDDDANEPEDGVFGILADDDECRTCGHGNDVDQEEGVC